MKYFQKIADGVDLVPLRLELGRNPQLWDQYTARKVAPNSPHAVMSDIWVRWRDPVELTSPQAFGEPHLPIWYPAWTALPSLRPIIRSIAARVGADHIGGILITRIPPGGVIQPHADKGWHPEYHNVKVYVPIYGTDECINTCGDEAVAMLPGEVWTFDNLVEHAVYNNSMHDRMTLIISMRCE